MKYINPPAIIKEIPSPKPFKYLKPSDNLFFRKGVSKSIKTLLVIPSNKIIFNNINDPNAYEVILTSKLEIDKTKRINNYDIIDSNVV